MSVEQINTEESCEESCEDSIVCYCYRLTTGDLKKAYKKYGSLKMVEEVTKAGTECTGCKVILKSLFGEDASDHYQAHMTPSTGTSCVKPGQHTQKAFIIADEHLESTVYSSNAVAPQLGDCSTKGEIEYALLDHKGVPVLMQKEIIDTNQTFVFDTRKVNIPRPFYGLFLLSYSRSNMAASRFNVHWSNGKSTTSTHENHASGRPRIFVPLMVTEEFLNGPNVIHISIYNPHHKTAPCKLTVFEVDTREEISWNTTFPSYTSAWINANEALFRTAIKRNPKGRWILKIESLNMDEHSALCVYFFMHNRKIDSWSCNHL